MASNNLWDLNDMLFSQLVRLDDDNMKPKQLEKEVQRSKAVSSVSTALIANARTMLQAANSVDSQTGKQVVGKLLGKQVEAPTMPAEPPKKPAAKRGRPKKQDGEASIDEKASSLKKMLRKQSQERNQQERLAQYGY
jgi:hypothetical protein